MPEDKCYICMGDIFWDEQGRAYCCYMAYKRYEDGQIYCKVVVDSVRKEDLDAE